MPALVVAHVAMYVLQALGNTRRPLRLALGESLGGRHPPAGACLYRHRYSYGIAGVATALTMIIPGILRAGGDTRVPVVITFIGFAGFVADEVVKAVIMVIYQRRETWLRRLT